MSSEDLKKLKNNLRYASATMAKQAEDEDAIIFNGATKSGKSTLLNYLIGNKLNGERNQPFMPIVINKADSSPGPEIGRDPASQTIVPTRWENQKILPNLALWDSPGFDDNRGPVQDITNAFYIYELLKIVKSFKIVLVTDINDIANDRINSFVKLLISIERLLGKLMPRCFSSIVVIFTKVPDVLNDNPNVNKDSVTRILEHQIFSESSIKMSETAKSFVRFLIRNEKNIGLFRKPIKTGALTSDVDVDIITAIRSADSIDKEIFKNFISPSIADQSKIFLYEVHKKLFDSDVFKKFEKSLKTTSGLCLEYQSMTFADQSFKSSRKRLQTVKDAADYRVCRLKELLNSQSTFLNKIRLLNEILDMKQNMMNTDKLNESFELMNFVDSLLELKESQHFIDILETIIESKIYEFEKIIVDVTKKISQIKKEEFESRVKNIKDAHSDEKRKLEMKIQEAINSKKVQEEDNNYMSNGVDSLFAAMFTGQTTRANMIGNPRSLFTTIGTAMNDTDARAPCIIS